MKKVLFLATAMLAACSAHEHTNTASGVSLHNCAIQQTIPGAKHTGAFLTIEKTDDSELSLVSAATPTITDHVEIHEMKMANGKMMMNQIKSYPLTKGMNVFQKGGYHIMLMDMDKALSVGEHHDLALTFSDGSTATCHAEVKSVKELKSKAMKHMKQMKGMHEMSHEHKHDMGKKHTH